MRAGLLLACLVGCSSATTPLRVFAASSLTDVMQDLEASFEAEHPGIDVQLASAGTQRLRVQLEQGAQADVLIAADRVHTDALVAQGLIGSPQNVAHNAVVVLVPEGSPLNDLADLAQAERLVVGAPTVPIGRYTEAVLMDLPEDTRRAIETRIVSREANVRLVRAKVAMGEADAAFVYRTDGLDLAGTRMIELGPEASVRASYPAAAVSGSAHPQLAQAFLATIRSDSGRKTLTKHGFEVP